MLSAMVDREASTAGKAGVNALRVGGVVPFSTMDWPDKLAAVVFLQGCPWRCVYCHNPHLVPARGADERSWPSTLAWLATRRGLLDAVVFSGGEPTAQSGLSTAIDSVHSLGFAVGLHTGGAYPRQLATIIRAIDWIGFDIKAPQRSYRDVTGVAGSGAVAFRSLGVVIGAGIAFEVRTTVHPLLTDDDALLLLGDELARLGVRHWILQPFRADGCTDAALLRRVPKRHTIDPTLIARLRERVPSVVVRS